MKLCIPTVNFNECAPWVFKTRNDPSLTRDEDVLMRDVALATSAAPWFFPIASAPVNGHTYRFVDGGLWANNPSLVGITEALSYFVGEGKAYGHLSVLSLGLPSGSAGFMDSAKYLGLVEGFPKQLLDLVMESQRGSATHSARLICKAVGADYVRIDPKPLSAQQAPHIGIDSASRKAIDTLAQMGENEAQLLKREDRIISFFTQRTAIQ